MEKKYELLEDDTLSWISLEGHPITLYRIRALKDFDCPTKEDYLFNNIISKGDLGGYIEKEENLSHEGGCWVYHNARVYGDARVLENAHVYNLANVFGNAVVKGYSCLLGSAYVYGNAVISGQSELDGRVSVGDDSKISGNVTIKDQCQIHGESVLDGDVCLGGSVQVYSAKLSGNVNLIGAFTINFDVSDNSDIVGYVINRRTSGSVSPIYSHIYLIASTKYDIWADRNLKVLGEDLIEYFSRNDPENIGYYCNLVEFHKKQYNL